MCVGGRGEGWCLVLLCTIAEKSKYSWPEEQGNTAISDHFQPYINSEGGDLKCCHYTLCDLGFFWCPSDDN